MDQLLQALILSKSNFKQEKHWIPFKNQSIYIPLYHINKKKLNSYIEWHMMGPAEGMNSTNTSYSVSVRRGCMVVGKYWDQSLQGRPCVLVFCRRKNAVFFQWYLEIWFCLLFFRIFGARVYPNESACNLWCELDFFFLSLGQLWFALCWLTIPYHTNFIYKAL